MARAKSIRWLAALTLILVLAGGGGGRTALAQRGRIFRPVEIPRELPRELIEPAREPSGKANEREPSSVFARLTGRGESAERSTWEREGSEPPQAEHTFRVEGVPTPRADRGATLQPKAGVILPRGRAFRDVFGRTAGKAESQRMEQFERQFVERKVDILGESGMDGPALKEWVQAKARDEGQPVVVIGHSETVGGHQFLVLPEGKVDLNDIHQWAAEAGSDCIVITCNGPDVGLNTQIRFDEVLKVWDGAHAALGGEPASPTPGAEAPDGLSDFVGGMSRARAEVGDRTIDLTVSTPARRPLRGLAPTSVDASAGVVWDLRMARPDRTLLIGLLIAVGLGTLHYAAFRAGFDPVGSRPQTGETFRRALSALFRNLQANRRATGRIAVVTLLLAGSAYLTGSELFMDWEEQRWGERWPVHSSALAGALLAALAGGVQLTAPRQSRFGSFTHGLSGLIVGATTAWASVVGLAMGLGLLIGCGGIVLMLLSRLIGESGDPLVGFLAGFGFTVMAGGLIGCLAALLGLVTGYQTALAGGPIHRTIFQEIGEIMLRLDSPASSPPTPTVAPPPDRPPTAKTIFVVTPDGVAEVRPEAPRPA